MNLGRVDRKAGRLQDVAASRATNLVAAHRRGGGLTYSIEIVKDTAQQRSIASLRFLAR
jgi:hypothetical protein